ncbi:MAG TPA: hypothetical protein VLT88_06140, partial [Desulfosarcina sp.]|nr:hypothetical protein [Desulfosarcina sp.]
MNSDRYLPDDIDPTRKDNVITLKERALGVIHRELAGMGQLHDDAAVAVLNDYDEMPAETFLKQLRTFNLILDALKAGTAFQEMLTLLSSLLRAGVDRVDGAALDALTVKRDAVKFEIDGKTTMIGSVVGEWLTILTLAKESRDTERQLSAMERLVRHCSDDNLEEVAACFKIPCEEALEASRRIGRLFDDRGNFVRKSFEAMADELAARGDHVFELLWCHFKMLKGRANRVAFLNALQQLIGRINRPKHALRFLLADFCRQPDVVA